ncbi:hypothetical protein [Streptomyces smyrnaeus]|uniref:hypothetical protein n=1 Tax=Streptomyces smyrnaeus TaxID=1387713 RepID=UPI003690B184
MTANRKKPKAEPYTPSRKLQSAREAWEAAVVREKQLRDAYHKAIVEEMETYDLSQYKMAPHTPYTEPHIRNIALEHGLPPKSERKKSKQPPQEES